MKIPAWTQAVVLGLALTASFFFLTGFGLHTELGYDDVMNVTYAWEPPLRDLLLGLLTPFTTFYRPTGSAMYRLMFEAFGLSALPFRIAVYALMILNLVLVYRLASLLSRSSETAVLAVVLFLYHGRLNGIYLNNGTLYDVLCASFFLIALVYYVVCRRRQRPLSAMQSLILITLFILALNAKEMAAALPVVLLIYELCYHPKQLKSVRTLALPLLTGVIVLFAAKAKMAQGSVMHAEEAYTLHLTAHQFLDHWRHLFSDLLYAAPPGFSTTQMLTAWLALLGIAAILRDRFVWFSLAFFFLTPLPVIFIPFRGFFVMYLPLAGWAMLIAALLVHARKYLASLLPKRWPEQPSQLILFASLLSLTAWLPLHDPLSQRTHNDESQRVIAGMRDDILNLDEPLPQAPRVLFLHDRFPPDAWGTVMICRLLYNDRQLWADRPTMMKSPPLEADYDRVFDYFNNKLTIVKRRKPFDSKTDRNYPE